MSRSNSEWLLLPASLLLGAACLNPALAQTSVDLALVLAVDVSPSMDVEELTLQRQGFIEAFRSPEVHEAVRRGSAGRIVVMYAEWAGSSVCYPIHGRNSENAQYGMAKLQA